MIDIREDETHQEYADRKRRELLNKMDARCSREEFHRALSDSIDAVILNKVTKKALALDNEA